MATVAEAREESVTRDETRQEQSQDSADGPSTKSNDDTGQTNDQARDETWIDKYDCFLSSIERSTEAMPPDKSIALDSQVMLWSEDPFEWSPENMASQFPNSGNTKGTYDLWPGASFSQGQFSTSHHWLQSDRCQGHMMHGNRQVGRIPGALSTFADINMPKVLQSGDDLAESHIDPNVLKLPSSEARVGSNVIRQYDGRMLTTDQSTDMNNPGLPSDNSAVGPYLSSKSCKSFIPHMSVAGEPSHSRAPSPYKSRLRPIDLIPKSITMHLSELQSSPSSGTPQTDRRAIDETRRRPACFRCDHEGCSFSSQTAQDLRFAMRQTLSPDSWSLIAQCRRHRRIHRPRFHVCKNCQQRFLYPKDLRRHEEAHHLDSLPKFHCPHEDCKHYLHGFTREDNLRRHLRRQHEQAAGRSGEGLPPAVPSGS